MDTRSFRALEKRPDDLETALIGSSFLVSTAVSRTGRIGLFVAGTMLTAVGVAAMILAQFGAGPGDVMIGAMATMIGISHGTAAQAMQAAFILVALGLGRRPGPGTIASLLVLGPSINLALLLIPVPVAVTPRVALAVTGLLATGVGVGLTIGARFGPSTGELWADAVSSKTGSDKQHVRWALEATLVSLGFVFGGPVGVVTIVFALTIGPLIDVGTRIAASVRGATRRQWERSALRFSRL
jgi:uncharacterized membrane protein YczE